MCEAGRANRMPAVGVFAQAGLGEPQRRCCLDGSAGRLALPRATRYHTRYALVLFLTD
jgi:hypothetical protein